MAYGENFHGVGFIQRHMVVICIWCELFVTSQFDVIFMFPNQRLGKFVGIGADLFLGGGSRTIHPDVY